MQPLPPVIVRSWKVLVSLQMASVNAADRGITSSHNFCGPMADACCQTVKEQLSFVTFSEAGTDLDRNQPVLDTETLTGVRRSHLSISSWNMLKVFASNSKNHVFIKVSVSHVFCPDFVSEIPLPRYEVQSSGAEVSAISSVSKCALTSTFVLFES